MSQKTCPKSVRSEKSTRKTYAYIWASRLINLDSSTHLQDKITNFNKQIQTYILHCRKDVSMGADAEVKNKDKECKIKSCFQIWLWMFFLATAKDCTCQKQTPLQSQLLNSRQLYLDMTDIKLKLKSETTLMLLLELLSTRLALFDSIVYIQLQKRNDL